jgi:glucose/arabinose dehydrogenase
MEKSMRLAVAAFAMIAATGAFAAEPILKGPDAFGGWQQDKPGVTRFIGASDLPAPDQSQSPQNFASPVERPQDAVPVLPEGFEAQLVASGIKSPRTVRVAPNGDIFIADSQADQVRIYRLKEGKAEIEKEGIFAKGLHQPYGIAFYPPGPDPQWIYVANSHSVVRFPYKNGDAETTAEPEVIVDHIPEAHHWTRDIVFSPDGSRLYLSVGSGSNVAMDMSPQPFTEGGLEAWKRDKALGAAWDTEERRADVLSYTPEGKDEKVHAAGLRNCSGMAVQPGNGALWCVVNERDGLGDNTPFDYATSVQEGKFYGWPWYYIGGNEDPRRKGERPDLAQQVTVPDVLFQAHSAPLAITFYEGDALPPEYKGNAFVTMHGSWNRGARTGYKVVMLPFKDGKPTGEYQDFMTGFVLSDDKVWGRPVGIAVAKDGSLLVSEDGNGTIWRVTYTEPPITGESQ